MFNIFSRFNFYIERSFQIFEIKNICVRLDLDYLNDGNYNSQLSASIHPLHLNLLLQGYKYLRLISFDSKGSLLLYIFHFEAIYLYNLYSFFVITNHCLVFKFSCLF